MGLAEKNHVPVALVFRSVFGSDWHLQWELRLHLGTAEIAGIGLVFVSIEMLQPWLESVPD